MNINNDMNIEILVKHVLFRLGEIEKVVLLESLSYEKEMVDDLKSSYLVTWVPNAEAVRLEPENKVFLPSLSCKALMETFLGIGGQLVSDELLSLLLRGVTVHIKADSVELLTIKTPKMPLIQKHYDALKVLTESGLVIKKQQEDYEFKSVSQSTEVHGQGNLMQHTKKLLNEQQVRDYEQLGAEGIMVNQSSIITPLAQDYLRHSQLKIVRE